MGLDLAIGGLVLVAAIRGWSRGFLIQAIRMGGLVGCVYLADPVRDLARPYVAPQLPTIRPDLLERMLWWASCVAAYVVTVGLASWFVKASKRRTMGDPDVNKGDKAAGFVLGAVKGVVSSMFLVAALDQYAMGYLRGVPTAEEQARDSQALAWSTQYRPAERIWEAPVVQAFVDRIRSRGLPPRQEPGRAEATAQAPTRPRAMTLPGLSSIDEEPGLEGLDEAIKNWR